MWLGSLGNGIAELPPPDEGNNDGIPSNLGRREAILAHMSATIMMDIDIVIIKHPEFVSLSLGLLAVIDQTLTLVSDRLQLIVFDDLQGKVTLIRLLWQQTADGLAWMSSTRDTLGVDLFRNAY